MTKIILFGCNGRMGQVVSRLAESMDDVEIVCGIDINEVQKNNYPVYKDPYDFKGKADAIIDFSHPDMLGTLLNFAVTRKIPAVIATTGLLKKQIEALRLASLDVAIFYSANMSLGVNLLIELVKNATCALGDDFDIEIIEKHHNQKIDAPSGTALAIADAIAEASASPMEYTYDRHSVRKKRSKNEIGIHAIRGGTIVGEHEVIFAGKDEIITIKHTAMSREIFASGAIKAAKYISTKKNGLFNMKDLVLNN